MPLQPVDLNHRLHGRVAVITGGASGIGHATALRLAAEGATVVIGDQDEAAGMTVADQVSGLFVPVDVTSEDEVESLFDTTYLLYGAVDIAFNNVGIAPVTDGLIESTDLATWQHVHDVNLTSVFLCCRAALRFMTRQQRGSIVNTASFAALLGSATSQISYTSSKGGVLAFGRELAVQYARRGIRVNTLCPGPVNTRLLRTVLALNNGATTRRLVHIPLGRFAEPAEIAAAVAFLVSDDASFITGATFLVDGGITAAFTTPT